MRSIKTNNSKSRLRTTFTAWTRCTQRWLQMRRSSNSLTRTAPLLLYKTSMHRMLLSSNTTRCISWACQIFSRLKDRAELRAITIVKTLFINIDSSSRIASTLKKPLLWNCRYNLKDHQILRITEGQLLMLSKSRVSMIALERTVGKTKTLWAREIRRSRTSTKRSS